MADQDCVFCRIVTGEAEASLLAASDVAVAFLDIRPVGEGHALVTPRRHVVGLVDLTYDEGAELMWLGRRIAAAQLQLGLAEGVNLFLADGEVAGQEVFHTHLHVVARRPDDGMHLHVDYPPAPNRQQLDATAERIRAVL